jgi:hypothetical protein
VIPAERDPALRRFERAAGIACLVLAAAGFAVSGWRPDMPVGIVAGGLLMALSYRAIKGGVDVVMGRAAGPPAGAAPGPTTGDASGEAGATARPARGRQAVAAVKFFTRYALLAVGAYVMLTCFRVHPAGLVVGALSPFLAAVTLAARMSRRDLRRRNP